MGAIFKRDFRSYFTSPIGYAYVGAFVLVMNLYFYLANVASGYSDMSEVFSFMLVIMMFTTPVLTMRIFSEEFKQKTDQLLLTSPVKLWQIVAGKFFACLSVFGIVLAFTLIWPAIVTMFGVTNSALVLANYLALISVASVYISLGLFISSLTESQLVAAVGSLGLFIGIYLIDFAVSVLSGAAPAWLVNSLSFISIFSRFEVIKQGVFSLADIIFYISVTVIFLFLSVRILERKRWS